MTGSDSLVDFAALLMRSSQEHESSNLSPVVLCGSVAESGRKAVVLRTIEASGLRRFKSCRYRFPV